MLPVTLGRKAFARAFALAFAVVIATAGSTVAASPSHGVEATCLYKSFEIDGNTRFELNKIVVDPPTTLYGHWPGQTVGWRVVVERSYPNNDGPQPWNQWRSVFIGKIQESIASPDQPGAFTTVRARISYVASVDEWPDGYRSWFRTIAKFYRFNADGSVDTHGRHKVPHMDLIRDGEYVTTQYGVCDGAWLDQESGPPFPF